MSAAPTPTPVRLSLESPSLERLLADHLGDVGRGGMFIRSDTPAPVGTPLSFEFLLAGSPFFSGEGTVVWNRVTGKAASPPGMGVRFERLSPESQRLLDRLLGEKHRRTKSQPGQDDDGVPEFLDDSARPTVRVAADRVAELAASTLEGNGHPDTRSTMRLAPDHVAALIEASRAGLLQKKEAHLPAPAKAQPPQRRGRQVVLTVLTVILGLLLVALVLMLGLRF
jgi:uncharacterized protein (TIGR02266 family)